MVQNLHHNICESNHNWNELPGTKLIGASGSILLWKVLHVNQIYANVWLCRTLSNILSIHQSSIINYHREDIGGNGNPEWRKYIKDSMIKKWGGETPAVRWGDQR